MHTSVPSIADPKDAVRVTAVVRAAVQTSQGSRVFNTHVIISGSGVIEAAYRKIHLFDVVSSRTQD